MTPLVGMARAVSPPPPAAVAVLSVFEREGTQGLWLRLIPTSGRRDVIARLEPGHTRYHVAWSPNLRRAMIAPVGAPLVPGAGGARLMELDLARSAWRAWPAPPLGAIADLGYDSRGLLVALTLQTALVGPKTARTFYLGGRSYHVGRENPLSHAYRLEGGIWTRLQSANTPALPGEPPNMGVLAIEATLAGRGSKPLAANPDQFLASHTLQPVTDPTVLTRCQALDPAIASEPAIKQGRWQVGRYWGQLRTPVGSVLIGLESRGKLRPHFTGPVAFLTDKGVVVPAPGLGLDHQTRLAPQLKGAVLLLSTFEEGAKPRLYDLRERKLLYTSDTATGAVFWPTLK